MGDRTEPEAYNELRKAGIPSDKAEAISKGARKKYCIARDFVKGNKHKIQ